MPRRSVITLLTDFGRADSYVAEVKGVLLSRTPDAIIVDVTHDVPPGDLIAAQYIIGRVWDRFPAGTVHVVVVDPGVGSERRALAIAAHGSFFVGPDNGVFSPVLEQARIVSLSVPTAAAPTFHGRDVFAPAAAALASGTPLAALGTPVTDPIRQSLPAPHREGGDVVGTVLLADHFGNLVTNIPVAMVPDPAAVVVGGRSVGPLRRTFADAPVGGLLAYVGSGGTVEIAVRDGSAAERLGGRRGAVVSVTPG